MSLTAAPIPAARPAIDPAARRVRWVELTILLLVAYGHSIVYSIGIAFSHPYASAASPENPVSGIAGGIVNEIAQIALLGYILFRQGRAFRDIGLNFQWWDILRAGALYYVAAWAYWIFFIAGQSLLSHHGYSSLPRHALNVGFVQAAARQSGFGIFVTVFYGVLNPFAEELIVRAYTMSEVAALTGKPALAVAVSVLIQVSYHFYQGILPPIGYLGLFLVFALYYARLRRIFPVILAHMGNDLSWVFGHL